MLYDSIVDDWILMAGVLKQFARQMSVQGSDVETCWRGSLKQFQIRSNHSCGTRSPRPTVQAGLQLFCRDASMTARMRVNVHALVRGRAHSELRLNLIADLHANATAHLHTIAGTARLHATHVSMHE